MNPELEAINRELALRQQGSSTEPATSNTLDSVAQSVYNPTLAASQGLIQGVQNIGEQGTLALRNITDSLGLTSPEKTQALRQQNAEANQVTEAAAKKLESPIAGKVGKFVGEVAPLVGLGAAYGGASIASQAGSAALQSGLTQDANSGITGQLQSAGLGAAAAGILGAGTKYIGSKLAFKIDPAKAEYYRAAKVDPRASQVAADPKVANTYAWIEKSLAKLPGPAGIKGAVAKQEAAFAENFPKIIDELDGKIIKSAPLFAEAVDSPAVNLKTYVAPEVLGEAKRAAKKLTAYGEQAPRQVIAKVQELLGADGNGVPMTVSELQQAKLGIDEIMNSLKGGSSAEKDAFWILNDIRKGASEALKRVTAEQGVGQQYALANKAWVTEKWIDKLKTATANSYSNGGDALSGDAFKIDMFSKNINKVIKQMTREGFEVPDEVRKAIQPVKSIVAYLQSPAAIKAGKSAATDFINPFKTEGQLTGAAGAGAALAGGIPTLATGAIGSAITYGLGKLVTTPRGLKLLASAAGKGLGHDAMRSVLTTAAAIGSAAAVHKQEMTTQDELKKINAELIARQQEQPQGEPN